MQKYNSLSAVAYVRYSSHMQDDGNSVAAQTTSISTYAESNGMEIEGWYIDMARTGRNTNRQEYQRMKQDIEDGKVQAKVILVRAIDRMHRNAKNQLIDVEWCEKHGIRIIGVSDGTDTATEASKLLITVKAAVAEDFSNTLSKNTRAALLECAKACKHLGGTPPLGYTVNSEGTYDIDESTAPIIRAIYKLYLQDMGYNYIMKYLKNKGYKTSEGNDFSKASLNAILRNPKYKGTYTYDRTAPKDSDGKRNSHAEKTQYTVIENGMPAIISAEDFDKVQAKMKANAGRHAQRAGSNYYALNGKIKCADCGRAVTGNVNYSKGKKYLQYRCTCDCKHKSIQVNRFNDVTFYALQQCLFSADNKERIVGIMNDQLRLEAHQRSAEVAAIKDKIDKLNLAQNHLLASLEAGQATDTIMKKLEKNEAEIAALTEQLEAKVSDVSAVDDNTYNELVKHFVSYMGNQKTPQAVDLRNAAIDRIEVGSDKTTIFFKHGVSINQDTQTYFDNEKNWEA
ncbi:MAG: recombinase family protein [Oscillospiraceae bacterium]|nr:recombinase family protein [Oscillospiraceae bacterium]